MKTVDLGSAAKRALLSDNNFMGKFKTYLIECRKQALSETDPTRARVIRLFKTKVQVHRNCHPSQARMERKGQLSQL